MYPLPTAVLLLPQCNVTSVCVGNVALLPPPPPPPLSPLSQWKEGKMKESLTDTAPTDTPPQTQLTTNGQTGGVGE